MVTVSDTAHLANGTRCELGEGPFWDAPRGRLLWVDIVSGTVHMGVLQDDGAVETVQSVPFDETIGAVAPAASGQWILAGSDRILMRTPDGHLTPGPTILPGDGRRRCNDAKPDPAGRFVVGTLHAGGAQQVPAEVLLRIEPDGDLTTIDDDLTLANGLAWSRDGTRMYSVDTLRQVVYVRSYDPVSGATGARSELVRLDDGYPDGMCLDTEEHLWVAVWGRGRSTGTRPRVSWSESSTCPRRTPRAWRSRAMSCAPWSSPRPLRASPMFNSSNSRNRDSCSPWSRVLLDCRSPCGPAPSGRISPTEQVRPVA
ncbi:Sugar lactone lactonase YvrE [Ruania alba]|uniref:Sugar lactone lactonase YvrE n=1 Tax=Ruania alba TaxID=648782 RepID=A0A1H5CYS7_9MICO|nr:Sugar lactone lactonase YvrE [Ruania alba]